MKGIFVNDFKIISHDKKLLFNSLLPFPIIIFLLFIFPMFSEFFYSKTGFHINEYYSIVAITLVCLFPYLIGMLYENVLRDYQSSDPLPAPIALRSFLFVRMFFISIISFVFVLLTILLVKPVPTEGWLRNLFATCLISIQAPFVFVMICTNLKNKVKRSYVFVYCSIFLITIPFGLLVHHPWNYFVFFSPLYWVSWAWVIRSPLESLLYGTITVIITSVALTIFLRSLLRKNSI